MTDEYMDLVNQLSDSWEPAAVVMDRDRGIYLVREAYTRSTSSRLAGGSG
jgi:hypothetical protein